MNSLMTVYESEESRARPSAKLEGFERFLSKLGELGIGLRRILCSEKSDIDSEEALELVSRMGMSVLPVTVYDGVCVEAGRYPDDQTLVDYLDVPDGVLGADRTRAPEMPNDMTPHCFLRPRDMAP